jgi:hypothetical protein
VSSLSSQWRRLQSQGHRPEAVPQEGHHQLLSEGSTGNYSEINDTTFMITINFILLKV